MAQERRTNGKFVGEGAPAVLKNNSRDLALGEHSTFILVLCTPQKANLTELGVHKFGFGKDVPLLNFKVDPNKSRANKYEFFTKKGPIHNFIKVWGKNEKSTYS